MSEIPNLHDSFSLDPLERSKGDAVAEIKDYWGEAGIEEIHAQILQWNEARA